MEKYKAIERSKEIGSNKTLLNKGLVPGIIYGKGSEPLKIAFENKILDKLMNSGSFYSKIDLVNFILVICYLLKNLSLIFCQYNFIAKPSPIKTPINICAIKLMLDGSRYP